ncbi:hypothetical protein [Janthinobacterium sp. ROICE36]|uniref:hypothetical protein n=1 Tax=Janthinobacterium sp. ROICE36 TaxID=2048670 RepID=UPI0011AFBB6E|nr:hypothetical protein [Janthinobacterium sp. ROICE36]
MHANRSAKGRAEAGMDKLPFRRMRHPRLTLAVCAGMWRSMAAPSPPLGRLQTIACLALLFAVPPAVTCIATGRAGVPMLFSTACGVVSCAAAAGSVSGW